MSSSPKTPNQPPQRARQRKPLKIVVVGSASVGKTSILRQFVYKTYDPKSTQTTIGCDFWHRNLTVTPPVGFFNNSAASAPSSTASSPIRNNNNGGGDSTLSNNNNSSTTTTTMDVSLQVWDTAGMDTGFQSLAPSFFRGADGALLVYDITNPQSFEHAKTWRDMFVTHAGHHAPILLVGNKLDLAPQERKIKKEDAENFVKQSTETRQRLAASDSSNNSSFSSDVTGGSSSGNNNNGGIMVCGAVELTASDAEAVEKAFIQLTTAMLEVEKSRASSDAAMSQQDLKRVRLGSLAPSDGRDGNNNNGSNNGGGTGNNGKNCKC